MDNTIFNQWSKHYYALSQGLISMGRKLLWIDKHGKNIANIEGSLVSMRETLQIQYVDL